MRAVTRAARARRSPRSRRARARRPGYRTAPRSSTTGRSRSRRSCRRAPRCPSARPAGRRRPRLRPRRAPAAATRSRRSLTAREARPGGPGTAPRRATSTTTRLECAARPPDQERRRPGDPIALGCRRGRAESLLDPRRPAVREHPLRVEPWDGLADTREQVLGHPAAVLGPLVGKEEVDDVPRRRCCPAASAARSAASESGPRKARPRKTMRTRPVRT